MKKVMKNIIITTTGAGVIAGAAMVAIGCTGAVQHFNNDVPNKEESDPIQSEYHEQAHKLSIQFVEYSWYVKEMSVANPNFLHDKGIIIEQSMTSLDELKDFIAKKVMKYVSDNIKDYDYIGDIKASNISITDNSFQNIDMFNSKFATDVKITIPPKEGLKASVETFDLNFFYLRVPGKSV